MRHAINEASRRSEAFKKKKEKNRERGGEKREG
jgi:hypothetical protein